MRADQSRSLPCTPRAGHLLRRRTSRLPSLVHPARHPRAGALHDDVTAGRLPAFSFVSPDACHDMHGASGCTTDLIGAGDRWLHTWLPQIMAGPDYRAGRLTVIITGDEGTSTSNHIPTLLIAPTVRHTSASQPLAHCSLLRFAEDHLRVPRLGCGADATSLGSSFGL